MKTETKKALCFLFIVITYCLQAIVKIYSFCCLYIFSFMASVALVYVIKNKYLGFLAGAMVLVATEFYDSNYKYLTAIAFLLICAHRNLVSAEGSCKKGKKDTDVFSFLLVQLALFLSIALFLYCAVLIQSTTINSAATNFHRVLLIYLWIIGIFIYSVCKSRKSKGNIHKIDKQLSSNLRFMYLVSFFALSATVLFSYAKIGHIHMTYDVIYFPWFTYICSMVYNGDPYIKSLAESIGNLLTKISYKDKVKE